MLHALHVCSVINLYKIARYTRDYVTDVYVTVIFRLIHDHVAHSILPKDATLPTYSCAVRAQLRVRTPVVTARHAREFTTNEHCHPSDAMAAAAARAAFARSVLSALANDAARNA